MIGEVVSAMGAWNAIRTTLSTHIELAVAETLKGTAGQALRFTRLDLLHGAFRVERDAATGRDDAVRATGAPSAGHIPLDQVRARIRRALGGPS